MKILLDTWCNHQTNDMSYQLTQLINSGENPPASSREFDTPMDKMGKTIETLEQ